MHVEKMTSSFYEIGDYFEGIVVETFRDGKVSRPRVRPVGGYFDDDIKVEFPRRLREDFPIGSRFRVDVKVAQKHYKDGSTKGNPYLVANKNTIFHIKEYSPSSNVKAVRTKSKSGVIYNYVNVSVTTTQDATDNGFQSLRDEAIKASVPCRDAKESATTVRKRASAIKAYALARSNGVCEACGEDAPFITKNDEPFLEVHHIVDLKMGGADSYDNVAALCPNCHRHVTYGKDAGEYNDSIRIKIEEFEAQF